MFFYALVFWHDFYGNDPHPWAFPVFCVFCYKLTWRYFVYFAVPLMMELVGYGMQGIPSQVQDYIFQGLRILLLVS